MKKYFSIFTQISNWHPREKEKLEEVRKLYGYRRNHHLDNINVSLI